MNKSESIKELAAALCEVQKEIRGYAEDSNNPFFSSTYGDLTSVWKAIRKPLTDRGLSVVQTLEHCDPMPELPERKNKDGDILPPPGDAIAIDTMLLHVSGEWISGRLEVRPDKPGPQAVGSAITYGRRYSLAAIVGIAPEDDDGESATVHDTKTKAQPTRETKQADAQKRADTQSKQTGYRDNPGWTDCEGFSQAGNDMVEIQAEFKLAPKSGRSLIFIIAGKDVFIPVSNIERYSSSAVVCTEWIAYKKVESGDIPENLVVRISNEQDGDPDQDHYDESNPPPIGNDDVPF